MLKREPSKESTAPEVRFKVQAKETGCGLADGASNGRVTGRAERRMEKKLSEHRFFPRADLAQKLQQSRADALLDNQTRRNDLNCNRKYRFSARLGTKTDEKIGRRK